MLQALSRFPRSIFASFSPSTMPLMSRRNFRIELSTACLFPFALACVEKGVIGPIAQKSFAAGGLAIATIAAAPAMANITSFFWTRLLRGRERVRVANILQLCVIACVAGIALAPVNALGVAWIVVCVLAARSFMAGIITARSDLWRANYPRNARARATGKFTILTALIIVGAAMLIGTAMELAGDRAMWVFRPMYLAAAVIGIAGAVVFSRLRWRGRAAVMAEERRLPDPGDTDPSTPRGMLKVLRQDVFYRRFMFAQFVLGMANLASEAPFIMALQREMELGYVNSIALAQAAPFVMPVLTIPLWARLLDRVHIVRFRAWHSWFFVGANLLTAIGFLMENLAVLYAARILLGVAYGGGALAWNLGHHDFAPKHLASIYMGIHVTLTGVRGAIAPFLGAAIYADWSLFGGRIAWKGLGPWAFLIFAAGSAIGALLFLRLQKSIEASGKGSPPKD
ncbi:MAG: MFS transporter [Phycisphaeraceae bacterium]|nr:MAG: MFS transporter [Phycisphaeraceae bacterium]